MKTLTLILSTLLLAACEEGASNDASGSSTGGDETSRGTTSEMSGSGSGSATTDAETTATSSSGATSVTSSTSTSAEDAATETSTVDTTGDTYSPLCDAVNAWAEECEAGSDARGLAGECPLDAQIAQKLGGDCLDAFAAALECIVALDCAAYDSETSCSLEREAVFAACR